MAMVRKKTSKRRKIAIWLVLLTIFALSVHLYLLSGTSLYYGQTQVKSIKVYWKVYTEILWVNNFTYITIIPEKAVPKYTISDLKLMANDPINSSTVDFQIECQNFSHEIDFMDSIGNGMFEGNFSRVQEYENANAPDILVRSSAMENESLLAWSQVWNNVISLNELNIKCKPFLRQVAFNTWDGEYLFDGSGNTVEVNNVTFAVANVQKVSFEVRVPSNYKIQDTENINMKEDSGGFLLSKEISAGQTFHLTVIDLNQEATRILLATFSYLGFASIIFSLIIDRLLVKKK